MLRIYVQAEGDYVPNVGASGNGDSFEEQVRAPREHVDNQLAYQVHELETPPGAAKERFSLHVDA